MKHILLEMSVSLCVLNKLLAFYATRILCTMVIRARLWSVFWVTCTYDTQS